MHHILPAFSPPVFHATVITGGKNNAVKIKYVVLIR
jgi:hypothetical protein